MGSWSGRCARRIGSSLTVSRPRLIERLNAGLPGPNCSCARKLTLISALVSSDKTTLLCEWVAGRKQPVAWLLPDKGDDDPARFWRYVIVA